MVNNNPFVPSSPTPSSSSYASPTVATPSNTYSVTNVVHPTQASPASYTTCFNCNNNLPTSNSYTVSKPSSSYNVVSSPSRPTNSYTTPNVVSRPSSSYSQPNVVVSRPGSSYTSPNNNVASRPSSSYSRPNNIVSRPSSSYSGNNVVSRPSSSSSSYSPPSSNVISKPGPTYTKPVSSSRPSSSYSTPNKVISKPSTSYGSSSSSRPGNTYTVTSNSAGNSYSSGGVSSGNFVPNRPPRQTGDGRQKQRDLDAMKGAWHNYMVKLRAYKRKYNEDEAFRRFKKEVAAAASRQRRRSPPTSLADAIDKVFHEVQAPKLVDEVDHRGRVVTAGGAEHQDLRSGHSNIYTVRDTTEVYEDDEDEEEDIGNEIVTSFEVEDEEGGGDQQFYYEEVAPQSLQSLSGIRTVPLGSSSSSSSLLPTPSPIVVGKGLPPPPGSDPVASSLANYPREIEEFLASATPASTPNPFTLAGISWDSPVRRQEKRY